MVVMTVISVVSGFALVRLDRARNFQQRENVALQLKSQLERARFDAVKRRATAASGGLSTVRINQTSYSLQIDSNQNGTLEPSESQNFTFDSSVGGRFVGNLKFPITISFDHHGRTKTTDSTNAEINSVLTLCNENCVSANNELFLTKANSSVISVSPTGTVIVKPGDVTVTQSNNGFTTVQSTGTGSMTTQSTGVSNENVNDDPTVTINAAMTFRNSN